MKEEKKVPTRRRTALRRTAVATALLLAMWWMNGGSVLPTGVLRAQADAEGTGPVELVKDLGRLPIGRRYRRVFLSANADTAMLSTADFYLDKGWKNDAGAVLDCSGEEPVHISYWIVDKAMGQGEKRETHIYCFGRVDDPNIQEVGMIFGNRDEEGELAIHIFEGSELTSRREDWVRYNGHDYFVMSSSLDEDARSGVSWGRYYLCVDGYMVNPDEWIWNWTRTAVRD